MMSFVKIDRKAEHREVTIMYSVENVVVFYLKPHKCIALHQIMMFVSTSYDPFKKFMCQAFLRLHETLSYSHPRYINIGPEFQAELPDLIIGREHEVCPEEPVREELLWKPWAELEQNDTLLQHGNQNEIFELPLNH